MTFGRCKVFQRDIKGRGFELPHQGVSSVGERGHRLTERTPFLGEEQALAVKDANPRISTRTLHIDLIMLGKLSIIGAVAAILMIPTALSAQQMGGAINPGVHVGGTVNPGATVRGAVEREVSLARIWGLGARRLGKFTVVVSVQPQRSADDGLTAMDKLLFWS